MKVLFIKDLKKQGMRGEIKEVKDGYAKNFLIKNGYAEQLNEANLGKYNRECALQKQHDESMRNEANQLKERLQSVEIIFNVKTGKGDHVFGSISPKQIKDELNKLGFEIDKKQIEVECPLSSLGYHNVKILLYKDIFVYIKVKLEK